MFWKLCLETCMLLNSVNSPLSLSLSACFHFSQETTLSLNSKSVSRTSIPIQLQYMYMSQCNYNKTRRKKNKSNQIKRRRMFLREQKQVKEVNKIPHLPCESRNVHGIGCEAHAKSHSWLNAQEPGNQRLQLPMDVQVAWKLHKLSLTTTSINCVVHAELSIGTDKC